MYWKEQKLCRIRLIRFVFGNAFDDILDDRKDQRD